jgi:hypothetical protein
MTRAERRRAARDVAQQASRQAVQPAAQDAGANRIAANRANADRSTGPRTEAGKERSRWNALTHGLYARTLTQSSNLLEADLAHFQSLRGALWEEYLPEGLAEERLVERMALLCWQHDRLVTHSERRLAARLEAGDDVVTALLARESTTVAESRLDRVIARIHSDLIFLASYRERARKQDARRRAQQTVGERLASLEAEAQRLLEPPCAAADEPRMEVSEPVVKEPVVKVPAATGSEAPVSGATHESPLPRPSEDRASKEETPARTEDWEQIVESNPGRDGSNGRVPAAA